MKISLNDAITIANAQAIQMGYDIKSLNIEANEQNTAWNRLPYKESAPDLVDKLKGKSFYAIYYFPKKVEGFGGELFIFVDQFSGNVITVAPIK